MQWTPQNKTLYGLVLALKGFFLCGVGLTMVSSDGRAQTQDAIIQVITGDGVRRSGAPSIPEALRLADNLDGSEAALSKAGKLNVQMFLKKPYDTRSLLASLRQVLNEEN